MLDPEQWARLEPHLRELPGGSVFCDRVREGRAPWPAIEFATRYCTGFPTDEFRALWAAGDFDVRWPLLFAAWYWGETSASVDRACARFLSEVSLSAPARAVLPEYAAGPDWLTAWRERFMATLGE
jgi:hypothetical protein